MSEYEEIYDSIPIWELEKIYSKLKTKEPLSHSECAHIKDQINYLKSCGWVVKPIYVLEADDILPLERWTAYMWSTAGSKGLSRHQVYITKKEGMSFIIPKDIMN